MKSSERRIETHRYTRLKRSRERRSVSLGYEETKTHLLRKKKAINKKGETDNRAKSGRDV